MPQMQATAGNPGERHESAQGRKSDMIHDRVNIRAIHDIIGGEKDVRY